MAKSTKKYLKSKITVKSTGMFDLHGLSEITQIRNNSLLGKLSEIPSNQGGAVTSKHPRVNQWTFQPFAIPGRRLLGV